MLSGVPLGFRFGISFLPVSIILHFLLPSLFLSCFPFLALFSPGLFALLLIQSFGFLQFPLSFSALFAFFLLSL